MNVHLSSLAFGRQNDTQGEDMETKTFQAPAIHCGHCTMTIQRELGELAGVQSVQADQNTKMVTVGWEAPATWDQIKALMVEIGYPPAD